MVTDRQTDRRNDKPSTVTLAAHARRGLKGGETSQSKILRLDCKNLAASTNRDQQTLAQARSRVWLRQTNIPHKAH